MKDYSTHLTAYLEYSHVVLLMSHLINLDHKKCIKKDLFTQILSH